MNEAKENLNKQNFEECAVKLLSILDARSRDIVTRRYGIANGKVETLDSIGKEYGVTRERVRQIEAQAKKLLAKRYEVLEGIAAILRQVFDENGGILDEDYLIEAVEKVINDKVRAELVVFYLDILPRYQRVTRSSQFNIHWTEPELKHPRAEDAVSVAEAILKANREPMEGDRLMEKIKNDVEGQEEISELVLYALLRASKRMNKTVYGEWGLSNWVETAPRGVGDKAYIVLRRHGKPNHFRDITGMINEVSFDHKRAHEQTVHNELIKDDRFVLVGRGMYGLTDWGFIPGTVADVLEAILSEERRPMSREELLEKVMEQRLVKKTTVLLGLQNNQKFQKVEGNKYQLHS